VLQKSVLAASVALLAIMPNPIPSPILPPVHPPPSADPSWAASKWGDPATDSQAKNSKGKHVSSQDAGSLTTVVNVVGARDLWKKKDDNGRAITGAGVTVALIDTGIDARVPGLDNPGQVIQGPDLSLEANSPDLRGRDTYGHGTHLAGIIAARDQVPVNSKTGYPEQPNAEAQLGIAPDARLLAVKVATSDGSVDVSQVIAALDWVVQHKDDNGMRIRVINLSYGTLSAQPYQLDPLAAAAENAWKHGIVVVVAAGNEGSGATRLNDPAIDPYVIAVGATDPHAVVSGWSNPTVAEFSSRAGSGRSVDLVAPGASIAGLRSTGSYIDVNHPEGLVSGDTSGRLFRGSGTSQAAAVTSGAVALLLQAYPNLTPDQVKAVLKQTARPITGSTTDQGAGQIDVSKALNDAKKVGKGKGDAEQSFPPATGLGSLEAARGGSNLVDAETGVVLRGEVDVQNRPWNAAIWQAASVSASAWTGGEWNGARWSGSVWAGANWTSSGWDGARWSGSSWADLVWPGARWSAAIWSGARWSGRSWQ
jgi:serine protease AprX